MLFSQAGRKGQNSRRRPDAQIGGSVRRRRHQNLRPGAQISRTLLCCVSGIWTLIQCAVWMESNRWTLVSAQNSRTLSSCHYREYIQCGRGAVKRCVSATDWNCSCLHPVMIVGSTVPQYSLPGIRKNPGWITLWSTGSRRVAGLIPHWVCWRVPWAQHLTPLISVGALHGSQSALACERVCEWEASVVQRFR